ncbi:unnamed protein product [Lampetra fluviatilis]
MPGPPVAPMPVYQTCYMAPWAQMPHAPYYMPGFVGGGLPYMPPYVIAQQDARRNFYQQPIMHPYFRHFRNPYGFPPVPYQRRGQRTANAASEKPPVDKAAATAPAATTASAAAKVAVITREVQTSTDDLDIVPIVSKAAVAGDREQDSQRLMPPGHWENAICGAATSKKQSSGIGSLPASTEPSDQEEQMHSSSILLEVPSNTDSSQPAAGVVNPVTAKGDLLKKGGRDGGMGNDCNRDEERNHDGSRPSKSTTTGAAVTKDTVWATDHPCLQNCEESSIHTVWPIPHSTVPIYDAKASSKIPVRVEILPAADVCQEGSVRMQGHSQNDVSSHELWSLTYDEYMPSSTTIAHLELIDERLLPRNAALEGNEAENVVAARAIQKPITARDVGCAQTGEERGGLESDKPRCHAEGTCTVCSHGCPRCHRPPRPREHCCHGVQQRPEPSRDNCCTGDEESSTHSMSTEEQLPAISTADVNTWAWLERMDDEYMYRTGKERTSILSISLDSGSNYNGLDALVPLPKTSQHHHGHLHYDGMRGALPYLGGNVCIANDRQQQKATPRPRQELPTWSPAVFTRRRSSIVRNRDVATSSSPVRPSGGYEQQMQQLASPPPQLQSRRPSHHCADADKQAGPAVAGADERHFARLEAASARTESRVPLPPLRQVLPRNCGSVVPSHTRGDEPASRKHRDNAQTSPCASTRALPQEARRPRKPGAVLKKIAAKQFPKTPFVQASERRSKVPRHAQKDVDDVSVRGTSATRRSPSAGLPTAHCEALIEPGTLPESVVELSAIQGNGGRRRGRRGSNSGNARQKKQLCFPAGAPHRNQGGLADGQAETDIDGQDQNDDDIAAAKPHFCQRHLARATLGSTTSVPGLLAVRRVAEGAGGGDERGGARGGCCSRQGSPDGLQDIATAYEHVPEPRRTYSRRSFIRNSSKVRSSSRGDHSNRQRGKHDA